MRTEITFTAVVSGGLTELSPRLWRYCVVLSGNRDTADDLAQAIWILTFEKSDLFQNDGRFNRWIFRVTQRVWLNELRATTIRRGSGLVSIESVELTKNASEPGSV